MQALVERCCGLDVHQETVVACLLIGAPGAQPTKEVRTFRTMTRDLEALRDWLREAGVTHVAMESTGVYWRPVYAVLEGHFELIVGNARHIRKRARTQDRREGRRGDRRSGAPWADRQELRAATAAAGIARAAHAIAASWWRAKRPNATGSSGSFKTANIKLASVASNVFGVSGRAMLRALIAGEASPEAMADLARGQLRRKRADLILALDGRLEEHHRYLLAMQL